jgi:hypothetical protein
MPLALPDYLSHYYDAETGPFRNLSDLSLGAAEGILQAIREKGRGFASQRGQDYLRIRLDLEAQVRALFVAKGGRPTRLRPHYAILGSCPWVLSWYPNGRELRIPIACFQPEVLSFTYGDTFPAMRVKDGGHHRGRVYTLAELPELVAEFGLPQETNPWGQHGPERYIEAQIWDDEPIRAYLAKAAAQPSGESID